MRSTLPLLIFGSAYGLTAAAQPVRDPLPLDEVESVSFAYADVLSANPVYEEFEVREPIERCRPVTVTRDSGRYEGTAPGTIVGAVIGGALGNQVGKGDGRDAATIAGAVIGGAIGREVAANGRGGTTITQTDEQCTLVEQVRVEQRISAWEVSYRYRGDIFLSRLPYEPGPKLKIRVSVAPADY